MSHRTQLKGVKKSRKVGHKPKHNKKSVALKRRIRLQKLTKQDLLLK